MARDYWTRYFGKDNFFNREVTIKRLLKWTTLNSVVIPDSGIDMCTLGRGAWAIGKAGGPERQSHISSYSGSGRDYEIVRGETVYISPQEDPLAILRVNCGALIPNNCESLLAVSHLEAFGVNTMKFGGIEQLHKPGWPVAIHCLPRGNGHFVPIRMPTKDEIATLPRIDLTHNHTDMEKFLKKQVVSTYLDLANVHPKKENKPQPKRKLTC